MLMKSEAAGPAACIRCALRSPTHMHMHVHNMYNMHVHNMLHVDMMPSRSVAPPRTHLPWRAPCAPKLCLGLVASLAAVRPRRAAAAACASSTAHRPSGSPP